MGAGVLEHDRRNLESLKEAAATPPSETTQKVAAHLDKNAQPQNAKTPESTAKGHMVRDVAIATLLLGGGALGLGALSAAGHQLAQNPTVSKYLGQVGTTVAGKLDGIGTWAAPGANWLKTNIWSPVAGVFAGGAAVKASQQPPPEQPGGPSEQPTEPPLESPESPTPEQPSPEGTPGEGASSDPVPKEQPGGPDLNEHEPPVPQPETPAPETPNPAQPETPAPEPAPEDSGSGPGSGDIEPPPEEVLPKPIDFRKQGKRG